MLLLPLLLLLLSARGGASDSAVTVDVVLSLCREENVRHQASLLIKVLEATSHSSLSVRLLPYCKCGPRDDIVCAAVLPNVGREAHTFVHHVLARYEDSLADVTLFLNGGFADAQRFRGASSLAARVGETARELWFADGSSLYAAPRRVKPKESSESFLARAAVFKLGCGPEGPTNENMCCRGFCTAHCCHLFMPGVCPFHFMAFDEQTTCMWKGGSGANYNASYDLRLAPAEPPVFPLWLARHWGLQFDTWDVMQWAPGGNFAASAAALRRQPRARWERTQRALAATPNGGVEGHYMERVWRTVLVAEEE